MKNSIYGWAVLAFVVAMLGLYAANVPTGGSGGGGNATNAQPPHAKLTNLSAITATDRLLGINSAGRTTNSDASMTNVNAFFTNIIHLSPSDGPLVLSNKINNAVSRSSIELGAGIFDFPSNTITVPSFVRVKGLGKGATYIRCPLYLGNGSQIVLNDNTTISDLTLDLILRTNQATVTLSQQSAFSVLGGGTDSTNILIKNVEIIGASDCVDNTPGSPDQVKDWTFDNCDCEAGWVGIAYHTSNTNSILRIKNSRIVINNDTSRHTVNSDGVGITMGSGVLYLENTTITISGLTNQYGIVGLGGSTGVVMYIRGSSIFTNPRDTFPGIEEHIHLNTNQQIWMDSGSAIDLSKKTVISGTNQIHYLTPQLQAQYLWLDNTGDAAHDHNDLPANPIGGLFFGQNYQGAGTAPFWKVLTETNDPNLWYSGTGIGSLVTIGGGGTINTNTPLWVQVRGSGGPGDHIAMATTNWVGAVVAAGGGGSDATSHVAEAIGQLTTTNGTYQVPRTLFQIGTNLLTGTNVSGRYVAALRSSGPTNLAIYPGAAVTRLELWTTNGTTVNLLVDTNGSSFPAAWYIGGVATAISSNGLSVVDIWTNSLGTNLIVYPAKDLVLIVTNGLRATSNYVANLVQLERDTGYVGNSTNTGTLRVTGVTTLESSLGVTGSSSLGGTVSLPGYSASALLATDGAKDMISSPIGTPSGTIVSNVQAVMFSTYTNYSATVSNFVFGFGTNSYELVVATNLNFTNITMHSRAPTTVDMRVLIRPINQNLTVVWPAAGVNHLSYNWRTNANSTLWTTLTNAKVYVATLTSIGTNLFPAITLWE